MGRLKDTVLGNKAFGRDRDTVMVDPKHGGQHGFMPDPSAYVSSSRYIRRNVIPLLIEAPAGFQDLEGSEKYVEALRAMMELHSTTIEGLNSTLNVEYSETPFGGAGEMQQDPMNVTRERSTPSHTFPEKYGRPFNLLLESWILNLIMDPETKYPRVISQGVDVGDLLPDYNSMTMLYIEPDPTHTKVEKAWLCTNMKPVTGGENIGSKEVGTGGQEVEQSIEFTAITQVGLGVRQLAQRLLDEINLTGANPDTRQAYINAITADVKKGEAGYRESIEQAGQTTIG